MSLHHAPQTNADTPSAVALQTPVSARAVHPHPPTAHRVLSFVVSSFYTATVYKSTCLYTFFRKLFVVDYTGMMYKMCDHL